MEEKLKKEEQEEKQEEKKECNCKESGCCDDLKKKLEECEKKTAEYLAGWQRERADFLNYKKEEMERITGLVGYAAQELVIRMFPILDNLDLAEKKLPEDLRKDENVKGLLLIKNQILEFLKSQGIEEIKSVGEKFDPRLHEIVGEVESSDLSSEAQGAKEGEKVESGIIIEEIQKGYKVNGELLRPVKVKVAK
jgi:molecular chaperone GrpE